MQFPNKMAQMGVDAGVQFAKTGKKPSGFVNTGAVLVSAHPVPGVASQDITWGQQHCWGPVSGLATPKARRAVAV